MVLDGENREISMSEGFAGAVVEVDLCDDDVWVFEGIGVGGEAVVLGGDEDFACGEVFDGLVGAAVAEFEFVGFSAEGVGEDLVAEADAEDGEVADEFF